MVEYLVLTAVLIGGIAILSVFLFAFREHGDRVLELVGYDYP